MGNVSSDFPCLLSFFIFRYRFCWTTKIGIRKSIASRFGRAAVFTKQSLHVSVVPQIINLKINRFTFRRAAKKQLRQFLLVYPSPSAPGVKPSRLGEKHPANCKSGNPESPKSCQLRNATNGGIEVTCVAGKDGGLPQSFVLEVSDIAVPAEPPSVTTLSDQGERSLPLFRVLGETPIFRLHSLEPGREYQLLVYAVNAKGRSEPPVVLSKVKVEVPIDTLQENGSAVIPIVNAEGSPPTSQSLTLILLVLTAIASLLIVGIIAVATILACRKRPSIVTRQSTTRYKPPDDTELSEAGFSEGFHRRSAHYRASLYLQEIDRNSRQTTGPDLILSPTTFCLQTSEY